MPIANLGHFDMVWALRQRVLNEQLAGLMAGEFRRAVRIGEADRDGFTIGGDPGSADEALLAPPTVESPMLDLDTGQPKKAILMLRFASGTIAHYEGFGPSAKVSRESLAGWVLAFAIDLNIGQVAHESLASPSKMIPPGLRSVLAGFDPSTFRIDRIFLDLDDADLTRYDAGRSVIPSTNPFIVKAFGTGVGSWLSRLRGTNNPFVFGCPVSRTTPDPAPMGVFAPSGVGFSTSASTPSVPGSAALNLLMLTGGKTLMDDAKYRDGGAGVLVTNLAASGSFDGVAVISRELFFNEFLRRTLAQPLLAQLLSLGDFRHSRDDRGASLTIDDHSGGFRATENGWVYLDHVQLSWHEDANGGDFTHDRQSERKVTCTVALNGLVDAQGVSRPVLGVQLTQLRYEWDQVNQDFGDAGSGYLGKAHASATLSWSLEIAFGIDASGKLTASSTQAMAPAVTDSGTDGAYKVADLFANLLGLTTISSDWQRNAEALEAADSGIAAQIAAQAPHLVDAARAAFVLPGDSILNYSGIRLTPDGDVAFDLRYASRQAGSSPRHASPHSSKAIAQARTRSRHPIAGECGPREGASSASARS